MIRKRGFTLVELNLAMAFVAILLLGVAMTTIHVTRIYQKGLTIRTINQLGREVVGQIRTDIAAASPSSIKFETAANSGRLCLGSVSYLYNTAEGIHNSNDLIEKPDGKPVLFTRVIDIDASWCDRPTGTFTKSDLTAGEQTTDLLTNDVIELAVHDLALTVHQPNSSVDDIQQALLAFQMQLGTNEAETTTREGSDSKCLPPTASTADFERCFIAEFETVVRAGEVTR